MGLPRRHTHPHPPTRARSGSLWASKYVCEEDAGGMSSLPGNVTGSRTQINNRYIKLRDQSPTENFNVFFAHGNN